MNSKSVAPRGARHRLLPAALAAITWLATACGGAGGPDTPIADVVPDAAFEGVDEPGAAELRNVSASDGDFAAADAAEPPVVVAEADPTAQPAADDAAPDMQTLGSTPSYCERVPPVPTTTTTRWASTFGAHPDDGADDTAALQAGLNALKPGETLALAPGRYLISKSLKIRTDGVTLRGEFGATIHATNPEDQAIQIEANNVTVRKLTLTAITNIRRSAGWQSRILIATPNGPGVYKTTYNTTIRDNRIVESGPPGTPGQNSSSSAGILVIRGEGFLIANNLVSRTLADGIHMTRGSRRGRVLNNTVRETGDDMIAMVSYAGGKPIPQIPLNSADDLLQNWSARVEERLDRRILVAGNTVGGQYWGRGISVVGGRDITIVRNNVTNVPMASAILLAREANYETFGVNNVIVEYNRIRDVQNLKPPYDPFGKFASTPRTGHGAIEIHASLFSDEARSSFLRTELSVRNVVARDNVLERIAPSGTRLGVAAPVKSMSATDSSGVTHTRYLERGDINAVGVQRNGFNSTAYEPIVVRSTALADQGIQCSGNLRDGGTYQPSVCKQSAPAVTGAALSCDSSGKLL